MTRALLLCIALAACHFRPTSATAGDDAPSAGSDATPPMIVIDGNTEGSDASTSIDAKQADAGMTGPNTVTCYSQAAPSTTCTLPTHCCFSNFDVQHNGSCDSSSCSWGTISCDGPEDCTGGQRCCAHAIIDPDQGLLGYTVACQVGACGAAPINQEICHPGTCATGTCVSALGHDNDLPRTLDICQ